MKMKKKIKQRRITWNTLPERIKKVRGKIESAGNTIGAVCFEKRTDETQRCMSFRLHVKNPSFAAPPSQDLNRRDIDRENLQMTVLDVDKVIRNTKGKIIGRGAYRTIPLENVHRVSVKGVVYSVDKVKRRKAGSSTAPQ